MNAEGMNPAPPVTRTRFAGTGLDLLLHDVERPSLDVPLDAAQVLPDEREDEALDAEDEDYANPGEERSWEVRVVNPVRDAVDAEHERGDGADHPHHHPDPLDRLRPEAGHDVQREAGEAERRVARVVRARRVADVDLHDRGAAREDERLRELLLPDRSEQRHDRVAPIRVERAAEVLDVGAGEAAEHAVDEP